MPALKYWFFLRICISPTSVHTYKFPYFSFLILAQRDPLIYKPVGLYIHIVLSNKVYGNVLQQQQKLYTSEH